MRRALLLSLCFLYAAGAANAQEMIPGLAGAGSAGMKVKTLMDLRFQRVARQQYDFSCGSAALASLLTYHYNRPIDERQVLTAMFETGDREKIKKAGFSLLDMKKYLHSIGLKAEGYRASLDKLTRVGVPAIVLINSKGYLHFVVVKGATKDRVLIGDPASGVKSLPREEFER